MLLDRDAIERELDLLASEIDILVDGARLLRKPSSTKQRKQFPRQEAAFRAEARRQMERFDKGPLEGEVSVQVELHMAGTGQQPLMPDVIKAYLDALQGVVYDDDRQVAHLRVRRFALDHPRFDGFIPEDTGRDQSNVYINVQPLAAYTGLYDRTYRHKIFRPYEGSPFHNTWSLREELELAKLKARRWHIVPGAHRESTDAVIALDEESRLTNAILADIDRPGPLSRDMQRAFKLVPSHAIQWALRRRSASTVLLPLPGQGPGTSSAWRQEIETRLARHRADRGLTTAPLRGSISLDIAVRGETPDGKDLDNLARLITSSFEREFCERPGTVTGYRAYRAVGAPEGVQVRIMDELRLLDLEIALGETRGAMVDAIHGPRREDAGEQS